ncbi:hypothetical protein ACRRTK_022225 [Alexandromys fortis]
MAILSEAPLALLSPLCPSSTGRGVLGTVHPGIAARFKPAGRAGEGGRVCSLQYLFCEVC